MNNKIRMLLLFGVLVTVVALGASLYGKFNQRILPVQIKFTEEGVDVQIENFKLEQNTEGHKEWEVQADRATINNQKQQVKMDKVNVTLEIGNQQRSRISADEGILDQETKDIELEGHVVFTDESGDLLANYFKNKKKAAQSTNLKEN